VLFGVVEDQDPMVFFLSRATAQGDGAVGRNYRDAIRRTVALLSITWEESSLQDTGSPAFFVVV